ncbi:MAG: HlyD family efflux transporter periplasmic adaptor subunit [Desulfitobacteriia bacterium]|jgi:putative membrane fusion protein
MRKNKKKTKILLVVIILFSFGVLLWNYRPVWLAGSLSLITAGEGWLKHEKVVQAVFANQEQVLVAPIEGYVQIIGEGQRFRLGETVAFMTPSGVQMGAGVEKVAIVAPVSGLFFSECDGLEQIITPENFLSLDLKGLLDQVSNSSKEDKDSSPSDSDLVGKYAPIGKIVNNLSPSWMFIYTESLAGLKKDSVTKFSIDGEDYTGRVIKLSEQPKGALVELNQYVIGSAQERIKSVIWNYKPSTKGLLVPLSAICSNGDVKGVYVVERGVVCFRKVEILDSNEFQACIEGIPSGIKVVTNPRKGIEGLNL